MKVPLTALGAMLALLVMAPIASANHVVSGKATCALDNNVPTLSLEVSFASFAANNFPITGTITVDGTATAVPALTTGPATFTHTYTQTTTAGSHTVSAAFTWPDKGGNNGDVAPVTVVCPTPTPPPDNPPTTPPTVVPPTVVPPAVVPPAGGVLPETIASGQARLRGPSGCAKQAFNARLSGRSITAVAFYLDGKLLKKFTKNSTAYSIKVTPKRYGFGRHKLVAKVTFVAASGTKSRTLPLTFRRCAQGAVAPRFTG